IDEAAGSIDSLLELADRHEAEGMPDAPWPPHYERQAGEAPRVQPSRRRRAGEVPPPPPRKTARPTRRRRTTVPMVEIARAATDAEAMAGLERWRARHPAVAPHLGPNDVLVDAMRGPSSTWTRIRVNLTRVPESDRPGQEPLEVDYDPWAG